MSIDALHDSLNDALENGDAKAAEQLLTEHPTLASWLRPELTGAMCSAAAQDHSDLVRLLLDLGGDPNGTDYDQSTPLHHAAWHGAAETAFLLLSRGAK